MFFLLQAQGAQGPKKQMHLNRGETLTLDVRSIFKRAKQEFKKMHHCIKNGKPRPMLCYLPWVYLVLGKRDYAGPFWMSQQFLSPQNFSSK